MVKGTKKRIFFSFIRLVLHSAKVNCVSGRGAGDRGDEKKKIKNEFQKQSKNEIGMATTGSAVRARSSTSK